MNRYAFFLAVVLLFTSPLFVQPLFAATATDTVHVQLLVDNGTSTSTTTEDTSTTTDPTPTTTPSITSGTAGNGQPLGPLSPNGNAELFSPLFDGSVVVLPDKHDPASALFQWKTSVPTSATLEWGSSIFYRSGKVTIPIYKAKNKGFEGYLHEEILNGLSPGSHYFYRITVRDEYGRSASYQGVYEVPLSPPEHLPENISELIVEVVTQTNTQIKNILRWKNPDAQDFSEVRVVRSPFGFPKDPLDGKVVYEGVGEMVVDVFASPKTGTYFYTVFVKGKDGTYSSGAVGSNVVGEKKSRFIATALEIARLNAEDFLVTLYDSEHPEMSRKKTRLLDGGHIFVSAGEKVTISAAFAKFPEILKTIVVYITPSKLSPVIMHGAAGPQKNLQSFLLSVNALSTAYEATFLAPSEEGDYDVEVKILDNHSDVLRNINAKNAFEVQKTKTKFQVTLENGKSQFLNVENPLLLAIFVTLLLLALAIRRITRFL